MSFESVLPAQNLEAEQCVLGSMLLDREAIGEVLLVLEAEDFYEPRHAELFRLLCVLYDRNQPVDLVLVTNELNAQGRLEVLGGVDALVGLMESVPSAAHAQAYAKLVRDSSERRRLVEAATHILREVQEGRQKDVAELLDAAERRIFAIAHGRSAESAASLDGLIRKALVRIDALQEGGADTTRGLRTHYSDLDKKLNGLAPGSLYVIAGRPSMGKTSLALNILDHCCVRDGVPALLFTLEVTKEQVAESLLCSNARVDAQRLMRGELGNEEYAKVPEAAARLIKSSLFIDDTPGLTLGRLRAKARRMKARHDIGLIVVDYLQLLNLGESSESRQIEISRMSAALKQLARELSVPVITLSQLNRSVEQRQDKRPLMGDLRESGSIEQDADAVLLLYREEYYNKEKLESRGKAELILAKNRSGPTGTIDLFFFPHMMRFENPTFLPEPGAPAAPAAAAW
ncbi:MAG TPA: replicative DNA helicase [Planctomycetota bacterium]|nr:replicative DNA helicase [Planctomycetota bacterium]